MNAKEYLSQTLLLDKKIDSKLKQVGHLREIATKSTTTIRQDVVTGTRQRSPLENSLVRAMDLELEIDGDIDKLVDLKRDIAELIACLENETYRLVLELRYLSVCTWEIVAEVLDYDVRWVHRLHGRALKAIEPVFQEWQSRLFPKRRQQ